VPAVIRELANGGDGVAIVDARGERRAIFVRHAAPGDHVSLSVDLATKPGVGTILRIDEPGPARVDPLCAHARRCGGCGWMHLSVPGQMAAHRERIRATLPEAWKVVHLEAHSPRETLGYRTRTRLHVRASGGRAKVGLQEAKTHEPVEVDRCIILHPDLERARLLLPSLLEGARGRGEALVALGAAGKPVLELTWRAGQLAPRTFAGLEQGVRDGTWAGARVFEGEVSRPAVCGDPTPWTLGADGAPLRLAPGGFAQASEDSSADLGARLLAWSHEILGTSLGDVIELFAGAGNFTVLLGRHARSLVAVESDDEACHALRRNLTERGLAAKVVHGLAERHAIPRRLDLAVLDPPRTGARRLMSSFLEAKPRVIAYVSCDVPTLARDLDVLGAAYEPVALEAFALFPHTPHVEILAVLSARTESWRGGKNKRPP
jgi:23S rRNA (uracil1939-C5)-methyltransferase